MWWIRLICIFAFFSPWKFAMASGSHQVNTDMTLYSLPGYDYTIFNASKKRHEELIKQGKAELVPVPVGYPTVGEYIQLNGQKQVRIGRSNVLFYEVKYKTKAGKEVVGYARARFFVATDSKTAARICTNCDQAQDCSKNKSSVYCQSKALKELAEKGENPEPEIQDNSKDYGFKTSDELSKYFYVFQKCGKSELFKRYTEHYQHYIREAAATFEVPEALLACLLFKENQWDQGTSNAGAIGIAQIMPRTASYINKLLSTTKRSPTNIAFLKEKYESGKRALTLGRKLSGQELRDYRYSATVMKNYELASRWPQYTKKLHTLSSLKSDPHRPSAAQINSGQFNQASARSPALAIGASALYLKEIMVGMQERLSDTPLTDDERTLNYLTAASGAYNVGLGAAAKRILQGAKKPPANTKVWVDRMSGVLETKKHMLSIRRCLKSKNESPPLMVVENKLVNQRSCL